MRAVSPATPQTDPRIDADFADWLAAYDESLVGGRETGLPVDATAPPSAKAKRAGEFLERLEALWPRDVARPPAPTLEEIARLRDDELRGRRFGRFVIQREMGRGGHGVVFLALDPALKRKVALKVPRPDVLVTDDLRRRFIREAQAAAVLDHPNIVPIYETGEAGPACYLAAAYCNGPTLGEWMQRRSAAIPPRQAALIALRMAEALHHAHDRQIFHRDVKPSNILLEPRTVHPFRTGDEGLPFTPKLTDFGLAKVVEEGHSEDTRTGAILGTPRYMSPEQAEGRLKDIGPATDVHGVGVTLYEMLAGQPPYLGAGDGETLHLVRTAEPTPPSKYRESIPRDLEAICLKCLEKEIDCRYHSAHELAEDLRLFLADQPTVARPIQWPDRVTRWARREPMGAAFAIGCVLAVLSIASTWVWYTLKVHAAAELAASFGLEVSDRDRGLRAELAAAELRLAVLDGRSGNRRAAETRLARLAVDRHAATALGFALPMATYMVEGERGQTANALSPLTKRWVSASLTPDGAAAFGVTQDGALERLDLHDRRLLWRLPLNHSDGTPSEWRWSPDGCRVALRRTDGQVVVADRLGDVVFDGKVSGDIVLPCSRRAHSLFLAVDHLNGLFAFERDGGIPKLPSGREDFSDASLFSDESAVILLRRRGGVKVVDLIKEDVTLALPSPVAGEWTRLALDSSNRFAAALGADGSVAIWDLKTGRRWTADAIDKLGPTATFRFLVDADVLVWASAEGRVSAWHVTTGRRFFDAHVAGEVFDLKISAAQLGLLKRPERAAPMMLDAVR